MKDAFVYITIFALAFTLLIFVRKVDKLEEEAQRAYNLSADIDNQNFVDTQYGRRYVKTQDIWNNIREVRAEIGLEDY